MANGKPRTLLKELLLEASLTDQKYLVVEGPSDRHFFATWLRISGLHKIVVISIEELNVPNDLVLGLALNEGNRSRVIAAARAASDQECNVRCVADRDCSHEVERHGYSALRWTDFPSLESYSMKAGVLQTANEVSFENRLPHGDELVRILAPLLRELFAVRSNNEHLSKPNHRKGFTSKPPRHDHFDVSLTVPPHIRGHLPGYKRSDCEDPRAYAYGHDISELLMILYNNDLKNSAGLSTTGAVENALLSALLLSGDLEDEELFAEILEWARGS